MKFKQFTVAAVLLLAILSFSPATQAVEGDWASGNFANGAHFDENDALVTFHDFNLNAGNQTGELIFKASVGTPMKAFSIAGFAAVSLNAMELDAFNSFTRVSFGGGLSYSLGGSWLTLDPFLSTGVSIGKFARASIDAGYSFNSNDAFGSGYIELYRGYDFSISGYAEKKIVYSDKANSFEKFSQIKGEFTPWRPSESFRFVVGSGYQWYSNSDPYSSNGWNAVLGAEFNFSENSDLRIEFEYFNGVGYVNSQEVGREEVIEARVILAF